MHQVPLKLQTCISCPTYNATLQLTPNPKLVVWVENLGSDNESYE